jgi:FkbM family methyltransferase
MSDEVRSDRAESKRMNGKLNRTTKTAGHSAASMASQYVWDSDDLLPNEGEVEVTIGDLSLALNLQLPHERRYALGLLHGLRNPQADIDHELFKRYVRSGDVILDAGANIGVTAAEALACGAGHVICVEPEHGLVKRLHALKSSDQNRITIWDCALGAQEGFADLLLSKTHNQGHTLSPKMASMFASLFDGTLQRVAVRTVDVILSNRPSAIWKLDVEGAEADVLRGARSTLEHSPPRAIIAELYDPFVDEFVDLLPEFQVRRAALTKTEYALQLLDQVGGPLTDEFCPTSPTYVFTRRD